LPASRTSSSFDAFATAWNNCVKPLQELGHTISIKNANHLKSFSVKYKTIETQSQKFSGVDFGVITSYKRVNDELRQASEDLEVSRIVVRQRPPPPPPPPAPPPSHAPPPTLAQPLPPASATTSVDSSQQDQPDSVDAGSSSADQPAARKTGKRKRDVCHCGLGIDGKPVDFDGYQHAFSKVDGAVTYCPTYRRQREKAD
jgi:hypothetical protein